MNLTTEAFLRLESHHLFEDHFCLVRRPNEKGHVKTLVGYARRSFLVPVPAVHGGLEPLNAQLEQRCRGDLVRRPWGKAAVKAEMLDEERPTFLPRPAEAFVAARVEPRCVDSLSLVGFDANQNSVPTEFAHHRATVVASVDEVWIVVGDRVAASHRRRWGREQVFYEPVHYLALLERKPGALDFAAPLEGWELPVCFGMLRRRLEAEFGGPGTWQFIKVLRLLERASLRELARAVQRALELGVADADAVRLIIEHRREEPVGLFCLDGRPHLKLVGVPAPDLSTYASLTAGGAAMSKMETKSTVLLKHHLKALKLPTMTAECEKVAARGGKENVDYLGFLPQLCELELLDRERRAAARRLKAARFPTPKALEAFDFTAPAVNKPLIQELMRCDYVERPENVLLIGGSGTGNRQMTSALRRERFTG